MKARLSPTSPKYKLNKKDNFSKNYSFKYRWFNLLISLLFGLLGGIIIFILASYLLLKEYLNLPLKNIPIIIESKESKEKIIDSKILESISRVEVNIYKSSSFSDTIEMIIKDRLGSGIILSNDGLILTTKEVISSLEDRYQIITRDKKIYPVEEIFEDPLTDLVFIKIKEANLPVANLSDDKIKTGQQVFLLSLTLPNSYRVASAYIQKDQFYPLSSKEDIFRSSEDLNFFIKLDRFFDNDFKSAPLINSKGEILGILREENSNLVIPSSLIKSALSQVLEKKKIKRNYLGITYIDLNKWGNFLKEKPKLSKGIRIRNIQPLSPADKAGLKENDIIIKVESTELTQEINFNKLIQEYPQDSPIEFTILRNGKERKISVTLASYKEE